MRNSKIMSYDIRDFKESIVAEIENSATQLVEKLGELKQPLLKLNVQKQQANQLSGMMKMLDGQIDIDGLLVSIENLRSSFDEAANHLVEKSDGITSKIESDWRYYERLLGKEGFINGISVENRDLEMNTSYEAIRDIVEMLQFALRNNNDDILHNGATQDRSTQRKYMAENDGKLPETMSVETRDETISELGKWKERRNFLGAIIGVDNERNNIQVQVNQARKYLDKVFEGFVSQSFTIKPLDKLKNQEVVLGSDTDKRESYANAQSRARQIESDYKIGIKGKAQAEKELEDLNTKLKELGLSPIEIVLKTTQIEKAQKKMEGAVSAVNAMGSSLSSLGSAIEVPELNVAGTLAQAIATMVAGYADATAKSGLLGPWAWLAFAATGLGQLAAMISSVKQMSAFATGGIVGGSSKTGDRLTVRVNSGEMILNAHQQARLFAIANGAALYGETLKIGSNDRRIMDVDKAAERISRLTEGRSISYVRDVKLRVRGRDLIEASGNELRSTRRRSNLR